MPLMALLLPASVTQSPCASPAKAEDVLAPCRGSLAADVLCIVSNCRVPSLTGLRHSASAGRIPSAWEALQ